MKEKIEAKVAEIIDAIIAKSPEDISYNEYRILDSKLASLRYEEEQKQHNKEMAELVGKAFSTCSCSMPVNTSLPEEVKED